MSTRSRHGLDADTEGTATASATRYYSQQTGTKASDASTNRLQTHPPRILPPTPPRSRSRLLSNTRTATTTGTTASTGTSREIYTTSEAIKNSTRTRTRIAEHDARSRVRLTPFLTTSELGGHNFDDLDEYDRTTAAIAGSESEAAIGATSSPATVIRGKSTSSDGAETVRHISDSAEPSSAAATDVGSTDRTEEAQMESSRQEEEYSEEPEEEEEEEGGEDDDDEEEASDVGEQEEGQGEAGSKEGGVAGAEHHGHAGQEEEEEEEEGEEEEEEEEEVEEGEEEEEVHDEEYYEAEEEEQALYNKDRIFGNESTRANRMQTVTTSGGIKNNQLVQLADSEGEEEYQEAEEQEDDEDLESVVSAYSEEEQSESDQDVDDAVREEMDDFCRHFKGIERRFRLISKIGEGTFSSVYKAEDLHYDRYDNEWDWESRSDDGYDKSPPPHKRRKFNGHVESHSQRRRPKYVAIKKIYVTSSPQRIMNELELLHSLQGCQDVVPLITAFRHLDQVVAILPYFKHVDFRNYFRSMKIADMRLYFRSLFSALVHVHEQKIIHRDIKPTNFLYDCVRGRGVLVDFGLAEREGTDSSYCPCQNPVRTSTTNTSQITPSTGYIRNDSRPSRRANRAGTRGFRAPEVLFKCTNQTTKIDIWSAGVVLLIILTKRFPFFNSADDIDATIEIATIFGKTRMRLCALLHGAVFETTIPTIGDKGFTLEKIIMWATNRIAGGASGGASSEQGARDRERERLREASMPQNERVACQFLARCLDLDPVKRMSAEEALMHPFLLEDE